MKLDLVRGTESMKRISRDRRLMQQGLTSYTAEYIISLCVCGGRSGYGRRVFQARQKLMMETVLYTEIERSVGTDMLSELTSIPCYSNMFNLGGSFGESLEKTLTIASPDIQHTILQDDFECFITNLVVDSQQ